MCVCVCVCGNVVWVPKETIPLLIQNWEKRWFLLKRKPPWNHHGGRSWMNWRVVFLFLTSTGEIRITCLDVYPTVTESSWIMIKLMVRLMHNMHTSLKLSRCAELQATRKSVTVFTSHSWIPKTVHDGLFRHCGLLSDEIKFYWDLKTAKSSGNELRKITHLCFIRSLGGSCHLTMTLDQKCKSLRFSGWCCHYVCLIFLFPADFHFQPSICRHFAIKLPRSDLWECLELQELLDWAKPMARAKLISKFSQGS